MHLQLLAFFFWLKLDTIEAAIHRSDAIEAPPACLRVLFLDLRAFHKLVALWESFSALTHCLPGLPPPAAQVLRKAWSCKPDQLNRQCVSAQTFASRSRQEAAQFYSDEANVAASSNASKHMMLAGSGQWDDTSLHLKVCAYVKSAAEVAATRPTSEQAPLPNIHAMPLSSFPKGKHAQALSFKLLARESTHHALHALP